jgi:glycosyltransferase involved in cell wall biosynthesis
MSLAPPLAPHPRVAVVYPVPFGADGIFGGGERYALELARALSRRVPTRLITFGERPGQRREGDLEIRIHKPLSYVHGARFNPLSVGFLPALHGVDVVHCVSWNTLVTDFSILAARILGKPVFVTDVGGGASLSLTGRLPLARWIDGFLLIAAQGGAQFEAFREKWSILYAGIDIDRYRPAPEVPRKGVLFVGRLLPHKGINYLVEALDPGIPLRIVGRPYHEEYLGLLHRLAEGKDVTFITEASDDDIVHEYQSAAVSVLSSVNTNVYGETTALPELLGFTAMEAMACGTPVLCSDVGALSEVVVDGVTGFLVPPNDPLALRARIRLLLDDTGLATRLGSAARQRIVARFTWEAVAERCLAAYGKAAGR